MAGTVRGAPDLTTRSDLATSAPQAVGTRVRLDCPGRAVPLGMLDDWLLLLGATRQAGCPLPAPLPELLASPGHSPSLLHPSAGGCVISNATLLAFRLSGCLDLLDEIERASGVASQGGCLLRAPSGVVLLAVGERTPLAVLSVREQLVAGCGELHVVASASGAGATDGATGQQQSPRNRLLRRLTFWDPGAPEQAQGSHELRTVLTAVFHTTPATLVQVWRWQLHQLIGALAVAPGPARLLLSAQGPLL